MNKYEIKYLLESMTSSVDRLTDSLGKQSHHISNQRYEIRRLKEKLYECMKKDHNNKLEEADFEKRFKEFIGESVDN